VSRRCAVTASRPSGRLACVWGLPLASVPTGSKEHAASHRVEHDTSPLKGFLQRICVAPIRCGIMSDFAQCSKVDRVLASGSEPVLSVPTASPEVTPKMEFCPDWRQTRSYSEKVAAKSSLTERPRAIGGCCVNLNALHSVLFVADRSLLYVGSPLGVTERAGEIGGGGAARWQCGGRKRKQDHDGDARCVNPGPGCAHIKKE
jgi:hypothetical protein